MHIARVGERLPRLQIQFRISRSFRPRNLDYRRPLLFQGEERQTALGIRTLKKAKSTEDKGNAFYFNLYPRLN